MKRNSMKNFVSPSLDAAFIGGIDVCISASDSRLSAFAVSRDVIAFRLF